MESRPPISPGASPAQGGHEARRALSALAIMLSVSLGGCASWVSFPSLAPSAPVEIRARVERPPGPGPFPAVVLLHGCGGVSDQLTRWARWLAGRGYLALVLDSFGPRGVPGNCAPDSPDDMPTTARFDDAMGALTYLQSRPDVVPGRIAAIGFSQGGGYAMSVINGPSIERARGRGVRVPATGYAAAIAVYPGGCEHYANEQVVRPLLVLIGAADDWTPAPRCEAMVSALNGRGANASIVLYPGAYHYFDVEGLALTVLPDVGNDSKPGGRGATVGYDAAAAADARRRIDAFLSRYLGG